MTISISRYLAPALAACVVMSAGCATKKFVRTEVDSSETRTSQRVAEVESQVEQNQEAIEEHEVEIAAMSQTAREALERALAAGKLAEGKLLYETVLSDDRVRFGFDQAALSSDAISLLTEFANQVLTRGESVYIEIQGHTDAIGSDDYNLRLGERRAEAVRAYLNREAGLPLHRMAVMSYGESAPVAANGSPHDRARNRRVAMVVLR